MLRKSRKVAKVAKVEKSWEKLKKISGKFQNLCYSIYNKNVYKILLQFFLLKLYFNYNLIKNFYKSNSRRSVSGHTWTWDIISISLSISLSISAVAFSVIAFSVIAISVTAEGDDDISLKGS